MASKTGALVDKSIGSGGKDDTYRVGTQEEDLDQFFNQENVVDIGMDINIENKPNENFAKFDLIYNTKGLNTNDSAQIITGRRESGNTDPTLIYKPCKLM